MRLIQCRRGPTSPSGTVLSAAPSGAPNSRNTSSTVSRGMLPTSRASVAKADLPYVLQVIYLTAAAPAELHRQSGQAPRYAPRSPVGNRVRSYRLLRSA